MSNETVYLLLPEIILALAATLIYLGGAFLPARGGWGWLSAGSIAAAAWALNGQATPDAATSIVSGPIVVDQFATTLSWAILGAGLLFTMIAARTSRQGESSEFMGSLLLVLAGLMLVVLANDLVLLFAGLELISIPTYVILFLGRGRGMLESGTKYFFLSVLSSAVLLYGFSFLYGAAGSTDLVEIRQALVTAAGAGRAWFASLALVLIFAGLGFRLTAVPFHFYAPDVYQGTTNPNAGLLAVVPKIAAVAALVRVVAVAMPGVERLGWQVSLALALVTMTVGNLLALQQRNVRRMLAYSSIAHAGYMLIGLAVSFAVAGGATEATHFDGLGATVFYLLVYSVATAGTFAALTYLSGAKQLSSIDELAGLAKTYPKTAAALAVFMFSLTGLPPLAGFWGKFTLFTGALGVDARNPDSSGLWPWFLALAIAGALNAAISAGYYLRIVGLMYFRGSTSVPEGRGGLGAAWATAICAALVIGLGCRPGPAIERANVASKSARAMAAGPKVMPDTTANLLSPAAPAAASCDPPRRGAVAGK